VLSKTLILLRSGSTSSLPLNVNQIRTAFGAMFTLLPGAGSARKIFACALRAPRWVNPANMVTAMMANSRSLTILPPPTIIALARRQASGP
jgi:hypothetical protein